MLVSPGMHNVVIDTTDINNSDRLSIMRSNDDNITHFGIYECKQIMSYLREATISTNQHHFTLHGYDQ